MKGKDLHPRLLYPAKLPFRMEGQIKCFPDKVKLKEFIITKPLLYEMLEGLIIKTMNSKMTANSQLSTTEPRKQKQNRANYNRNRITEMEITWRVINRGLGGRERGEGTENK